MKYCLGNCLFIIAGLSCFFTSLVSSKESTYFNDPDDSDESDELIHQSLDKSDWVDYGDMFTYDHSSKTNREPKLKSAVEIVLKRKKEAQQNGDQFEPYSSNCAIVEQKLRQCEATKRTTCDFPGNEHCGKISYLTIRRSVMKLTKFIKERYRGGVILTLDVNLDDHFFGLPVDFANLTDCEYLVQINPLVDLLISSIVVKNSEPTDYLTLYKYVATGMLILLTFWHFVKVSPRVRVFMAILVFLIISYLWEFAQLYANQIAANKETTDRLKLKCLERQSPGWFDFILDKIPSFSFKNTDDDCREYYIATFVHPLLNVNPLKPFFSILKKTLGFALELFGDSAGASVAAFFKHIPALYFVPILVAVTFIGIKLIEFFFKFRGKTRQKNTSIKKKIETSPSKRRAIRKDEFNKPKSKLNRTKSKMIRCNSLGNIRELY